MPHNGGRTQINFSYQVPSRCFPAINLIKTMAGWSSITAGTYPDAAKFDADGYMTTAHGGGMYNLCSIPTQAMRPGNYKLAWDGSGTVRCVAGDGGTLVGGGTSLATSPVTLTPASDTTLLQVGIVTVGSPHITNLRLYHIDDETLYNSGEVVSPALVTLLTNARIGVLRFMTSERVNDTTKVTWADRKAMSYVSWEGTDYRPSIYAGVTTNSGDDYSITVSGFTLTNYAKFIATFNVTSSTQFPTLNVNGTGAKPILYYHGTQPNSIQIPYAISGTNAPMTMVMYDSMLDSYLINIDDLNTGSSTHALENGIPIEFIVAVCNKVNAHPWFCIPHLALDPLSDYVSGLCAYLIANLNPGLVPRFEASNELFNTIFNGANHARRREMMHQAASLVWKGCWKDAFNYIVGDVVTEGYNTGNTLARCKLNHLSSLGVNDPATSSSWTTYWDPQFQFQDIAGRLGSTLGRAVSIAYGGDRTKYQVIVSGQQYGDTSIASKMLDSPTFVANTGNADDAARNWATHFCVSSYWNSSYYGTAEETSMAAEYTTATAARRIELINQYVSSPDGTYDNGVDSLRVTNETWKTWLNTYNTANGTSIKFTNYEGGYVNASINLGGSAEVKTFRRAALYAPALHDVVIAQHNHMASIGGEFASLFCLEGVGDWSNFIPTTYDPPSTQWLGISDFNHAPLSPMGGTSFLNFRR